MTALDLSAPVPVPITKRGWFIRLVQLGVIAFFVVAWEVLGQLGVLDKFYYSRPSLFIARIAQWFGEGLGPTSIWNDMRVTLLETVLGFVIGTLLGVTIGYAFARNQLLGQVVIEIGQLHPAFTVAETGPVALPRPTARGGIRSCPKPARSGP